jgi:molybdenum cofactor cytidylyltransferase
MIFSEVAVGEAAGAILAHGVRAGQALYKKGRVLSAEDIAAIAAAGHQRLTVARLEAGDLGEDAAAERIARAASGPGLGARAPFTGRCNLHAEAAGIVLIDRQRLDALNQVDEAVTLATLPPFEVVGPGELVATVKIIPFAVPAATAEQCARLAAEGGPLLRLAAFRPRRVALIQTRIEGVTKASLLEKTVEAVNARLEALGCPPAAENRIGHDQEPLAAAIAAAALGGAELIVVSGASAITDRRDVVPMALTKAGGTVEHLGMPVDPGNLLMLGRLGEVPVLGLPGCARSPKANGFDWVLQRLLADVPVTGADIARLGAGGLLKEIVTRPQPRAGAQSRQVAAKPWTPRVAALVLAAGQSRRMGAANKLLAEVGGVPMVVRAVDAALASRARPVVVVLGHEAARVRAALGDRPVTVATNPDYAEGISSSIRHGLAALPHEVDGAVICLGDMPLVSAAVIDRLIAAFNPLESRAICLPTWRGKRGNPVLWARQFFREMGEIAGDVGARHLIGAWPEVVAEVAMQDDAVLVDVDTPEALAALRPGPAPV